jgi:flavin-dependent dehydrogenase
MARRMAERGVRFVHLMHAGWDQHNNLPTQLAVQCRDTDQPSAALVADLKQRGLLDSTLVDTAREAGAVVRHGHALVGLTRDRDGRVCGGTVLDADGRSMAIRSDLVVGADGIGSSVARLAGAETVKESRNATAVMFGYFPGIELADYHWWYRPGVGVGAIPTNRARHCIFAAFSPQRLRNGSWRADRSVAFGEILHEADPALAALVAGSEPDEPLHVFAGRKGFLRRAHGPGWALVGDAGYFKDPITAHGISDALRDAELLARAVARGTDSALVAYESTRDALSHELFEITDAIAGFEWDLERLKPLHLNLSKTMNHEVEALLGLDE